MSSVKKFFISKKTAVFLIVLLLIILTIRQFHVITVNGESMQPSLSHGDVVLGISVTKPDYGDMIVFSYWNDVLIKRVIGLSGDIISIDENGYVYVNDELLNEPYVSEFSYGHCEIEFPYTVPDDRYFVLGDNRAHSNDSRTISVGCVTPEQYIAKVIYQFD